MRPNADRKKRQEQAVLNPDRYMDYLVDDLDYEWWRQQGEALSKKK